jgi:hypothetical protein
MGSSFKRIPRIHSVSPEYCVERVSNLKILTKLPNNTENHEVIISMLHKKTHRRPRGSLRDLIDIPSILVHGRLLR